MHQQQQQSKKVDPVTELVFSASGPTEGWLWCSKAGHATRIARVPRDGVLTAVRFSSEGGEAIKVVVHRLDSSGQSLGVLGSVYGSAESNITEMTRVVVRSGTGIGVVVSGAVSPRVVIEIISPEI